MQFLRDAGAVRRTVAAWSAAGDSVALVPTMGNLHAGHIALVEAARRRVARVVVSIFVNPTQFGPREDFAAYPRTLPADRRLLGAAGADLLFAPGVKALYPHDTHRAVTVSVPGLSGELCGASRPGHFDGVCSVVLRLLNVVRPEVALFGEKDFQQLAILRRLVADLQVPVAMACVATVREPDGLAMSSRNQYLTPAERSVAPLLAETLRDCAKRIAAGRKDYARLERDAVRRLRAGGFRPDYVAVRTANDLARPGPDDRRLRVLAAAWLGRARLIDNVPVSAGSRR
ncbi:MAG: pantoate--beta-alanine ligase [Gammaproteobacteria bacterium]|nr:pantoate--beta-alanine ligase [Gammaproteobacteria bacterium]